MDFFFVKLCWKNIWRNMRRTLLTITAIGIGVMSLVALYNYYDGFHEQVIHNVIRYHSGHLVVGNPGYFEDNTTNKYVKDPRPVYDWLARNDKVKVWTSRILVPGMLSFGKGFGEYRHQRYLPGKRETGHPLCEQYRQGHLLCRQREKAHSYWRRSRAASRCRCRLEARRSHSGSGRLDRQRAFLCGGNLQDRFGNG